MIRPSIRLIKKVSQPTKKNLMTIKSINCHNKSCHIILIELAEITQIIKASISVLDM